jgi:1-aminocyclopropane-1-carboxylate deaminase
LYFHPRVKKQLDKIRRFLLNIKRLNQNIPIQNIKSFSTPQVSASVLRLDTLHTIISGNKWYKLKFYIQEAQQQKASTLASFGGPYSNHLVALAFAAKQYGFKSIGYVRSNENEPLTPTLEEAVRYGMELKRIGRTQFQNIKEELMHQKNSHQDDHSRIYWIDEGGYGAWGAKGAATILDSIHSNENINSITPEMIRIPFTHIIAAVGTGTMLAGLIQSAASYQQVIGIPVLKNEGTIENEIKALLESIYNNNNNSTNSSSSSSSKIRSNNNDNDSNYNGHQKTFTLLHDFHLGGYAKTTPAQFKFMNQFWEAEKIPTDIVYTSKVFMAVDELIKNNYFPANSNLLIVHSGGLQGNRSLPLGTLNF